VQSASYFAGGPIYPSLHLALCGPSVEVGSQMTIAARQTPTTMPNKCSPIDDVDALFVKHTIQAAVTAAFDSEAMSPVARTGAGDEASAATDQKYEYKPEPASADEEAGRAGAQDKNAILDVPEQPDTSLRLHKAKIRVCLQD
jgi:hypothetical protein